MHPIITELTPVEEKMLRDRGVGESFGVVDCSEDFEMARRERRYSEMSITSDSGGSGFCNVESVDMLMAQVDENGVEYGYLDNDDYDDLGIGEGVILLDDNAEIWRADRFSELPRLPRGPGPAPAISPGTAGSMQLDADSRSASSKLIQQHAGPMMIQYSPHCQYQQYPELQPQYPKQFPPQYNAQLNHMSPPAECPFSMQAAHLAVLESPRKRKRRKSSFQREGIQKIRVDHNRSDRSYFEASPLE
ncbi:hypothetical protein V1517DRAFT_374286 [Lipomyces orientalis]|uniref:Uncharacterized protein n=1 Tax=Lipomyces orientalis TaxID=1233043 RepID=A0ACC3TLP2_9ASCO